MRPLGNSPVREHQTEGINAMPYLCTQFCERTDIVVSRLGRQNS